MASITTYVKAQIDLMLAALVPNTRTVNGKALSDNVSLTQDDVGSGTANKVYTAAEKAKLGDIAAGAQVNVQADWTGSGAAQILNKPAVIAAGADQAAARTSIGAGTSNLTLGTTGSTAAAGNDSRLSDARTPTAHTHSTADVTGLDAALAGKATAAQGAKADSAVQPGDLGPLGTVTPTGTADGTTVLYGDNVYRTPPTGGGGGGDVTGAAASVDGEVALFSGASGKVVKRATGTGLAKLADGVLGTATAGTDYVSSSDERLSDARPPTAHNHVVADVTGAEATANKGQPNGYASLGSDGKVPAAQLPAAGGSGNVTGAATSVAGEVAVFADTTGKALGRASASGVAKLANGVLSAVPKLAVADGGTGAGTAAEARTNLGATTLGSQLFTAADVAAALAALGITKNGVANPLYNPTDGRIEPISRLIASQDQTPASGEMYLVHFVAAVDKTVTTIKTATGAGSTLTASTRCKVGLYSYAGGTYTCIARSAHLATRWNGANIRNSATIVDNGAATPAAISSVNLVAGQEYAVAILLVSGTGTPRLKASGMGPIDDNPRICYLLTGATDLPATTTGSWDNWFAPWVGLA